MAYESYTLSSSDSSAIGQRKLLKGSRLPVFLTLAPSECSDSLLVVLIRSSLMTGDSEFFMCLLQFKVLFDKRF